MKTARNDSRFLVWFALLVAAFIFSPLAESTSHAKLFRNAYIQFDLPPQWDCQMEGTEWVCSSQNKIDSKESIIILTAKEVGPQDTFQAYETFLRTPKQILSQNGKPVKSQVKTIKQRKINDHLWVDALHLSSEIPGYYTRYLATIKDKLAILVTLSAHQKYYTKYSNDYFRAVESLRVVATKDLLAPRDIAPIRPNGQVIGKNINPIMPPPSNSDNVEVPNESEPSSTNALFITAGVILLAVGGYLLLKRKS